MLTVDQILKATRGKILQGNKSTLIKRITIDSRQIKKGDLFIAIKGERFDGHKFVNKAIKSGARVLIVSKRVKSQKDVLIIQVKCTTKALGHIASCYRQQFKIPVIAITGSTGKTTTKDLIAHVLKSRFNVLRNEKTENNHFGVPLTLLKLRKQHKVVVLELGTNQTGDIKWLTKIAQPTIAVYTNVGESHLQGLKTPLGVYREKLNLAKGTQKGGTLIFNADDKYLNRLRKEGLGLKLISYGFLSKSTYLIQDKELTRNRVVFKVKGTRFAIRSVAEHNIYNALAAICCGQLLRISYNNISTSLNRFRFENSRQELKKVGSLTIIDDSYNSNPVSFKSAIQTLGSFQTRGRRILVCADMLELGHRSKSLHMQMGRLISKSPIDVVVSYGAQASHITRSIKRQTNDIRIFHCHDLSEVNKRLKAICKPQDVLLFKGSRGMRMERAIQSLTKSKN